MKKLYWRPERVSKKVLLIIALLAIVGVFSLETFRVERRQPYFKEKMSAARLTQTMFETIKKERTKRNIRIDKESDPAKSGLMGILLSPPTTNPGHLPAKQTSVNPNFGAVVLHLLKRIGVEQDDPVAVGFSGSFPAINLAVLAALETIGAKSIVITSVGASQWGANIPRLLWPEMEKLIADKRLIRNRSVAYSLGGINDLALGLSDTGKKALKAAIDESGIPILEVESFEDSVEKRYALYQERAGDQDIVAYINVGGGTSSVGTRVGKKMFRPGLNRTPPSGVGEFDSVMSRFITKGIPVIHMSSIDTIAQRYGLPLQPQITPKPGEGKVFRREVYNTSLAVAVLIGLILCLWVFARMDIGFRLFKQSSPPKNNASPQQMV